MTKKEYMQRQLEERRAIKAEARKKAAKTVTVNQYIDMYRKEMSKNTKTITLEVRDRNFGVWAIRMPVDDFMDWLKAGAAKVSRIASSESMKRFSEAGKPCIRFEQMTKDDARNLSMTFGYEFKQVYPHTHAEMVKTSKELGYANVGFYFQHLVALAWNENDVGEADNKSHMFHADTKDANGHESECKCYNGFIVVQMSNEYWEIKG